MSETPKTPECEHLGENETRKTVVSLGGKFDKDLLVTSEPYCGGMGGRGTNVITSDQTRAYCKGRFRDCSIWKTMHSE